jgi:3-deoxy-D-manno-oct-2-ulosonic acid (Kdo) hydroxylase
MTSEYPLRDFTRSTSDEIEDALEAGEVVYFPQCPIRLPSDRDLAWLRSGLDAKLKAKNISYHPESDSVPRFEADDETRFRVETLLRTHGKRVAEFWRRAVPDFIPGCTFGTTSFRPVEEKGRDLKPRSSNELVHIDAGAYGATNGARILRFFVNVHPDRDRVWGTKGSFEQLMQRHAPLWAAARAGKTRVPIEKGPLDHLYSGLVGTASKLYPLFRVIDSSPYDRAMRRIHNYMKENTAFRQDPSDYQEIRFPPFSAWMVFTDGISHAALTGQYAFISTALIPLANCRRRERTPFGILAGAGAPASAVG